MLPVGVTTGGGVPPALIDILYLVMLNARLCAGPGLCWHNEIEYIYIIGLAVEQT